MVGMSMRVHAPFMPDFRAKVYALTRTHRTHRNYFFDLGYRMVPQGPQPPFRQRMAIPQRGTYTNGVGGKINKG